MKKVLTSAAADFGAPSALWTLLVGELALGSLLLYSDRLPLILVRSLQLFLRF